jgi:hypothetical protein
MHVLSLGRADCLIFNVDTPVEKGSSGEDVFLVQFLLLLNGKFAPPSVPAEVKARLMRVPQHGRADDATIDAIKAFQERMRFTFPATVVDGRVSPARAGGNYAPGTEWSIVTLNTTVRKSLPAKWPRLQDIPGCPEVVKAKMLQVV